MEFWSVGWDGLRAISYFHTLQGFLHEFIMLRTHFFLDCVFGSKIKCIHGTTVRYTKGNRIEKGFSITNARGGGTQTKTRLLTRGAGFFVDPPKRWPVFSFEIRLQFPLLPLSPSSSSLVVDDGAYGRRLSFSYSCSSVVALGLAAVSYDEGVSK